jgi:hypothetical protein
MTSLNTPPTDDHIRITTFLFLPNNSGKAVPPSKQVRSLYQIDTETDSLHHLQFTSSFLYNHRYRPVRLGQITAEARLTICSLTIDSIPFAEQALLLARSLHTTMEQAFAAFAPTANYDEDIDPIRDEQLFVRMWMQNPQLYNVSFYRQRSRILDAAKHSLRRHRHTPAIRNLF